MARNTDNGRGLEKTVKEIYTSLNYTPVKSNVRIYQGSGKNRISAQIDIIYTYILHEIYVECKFRKNQKVKLEEVAKFGAVLKLFNIPLHHGEMITNNYFDDRAIQFSKDTGLRLIDHEGLQKLCDSRLDYWNMLRTIKNSAEVFKTSGILGVIDYVHKMSWPLEKQIQKNSY